MAVFTWKLIDQATGSYIRELHESLFRFGGREDSSFIRKETLHGGVCDGVDLLHINNGECSFVVLPQRGMGLWRARREGVEFGWRSPVQGPVHPRFVPLQEPGGLGWLDGFDELLVRCGLESNGPPEFDDGGRLRFPLHGRIANRPAHELTVSADDRTGLITIVGVVEEARFLFGRLRLTSTITTRAGEHGLRIHDQVENLSSSVAEAQLLYHVNFGRPLLDAGSSIAAPVRTIVPQNERAAEGIDSWNSYEAPQAGFAEQVYYLDLAADAEDNTEVLLKNAAGTLGAGLRFNKRQLPCFTLWKHTAAEVDGYVTGLEPATNFPNPRSFEEEQGRVARIAPGESVAFDLALRFRTSAAEVEAAEADIVALSGETAPRVLASPQPGWCAGV